MTCTCGHALKYVPSECMSVHTHASTMYTLVHTYAHAHRRRAYDRATLPTHSLPLPNTSTRTCTTCICPYPLTHPHSHRHHTLPLSPTTAHQHICSHTLPHQSTFTPLMPTHLLVHTESHTGTYIHTPKLTPIHAHNSRVIAHTCTHNHTHPNHYTPTHIPALTRGCTHTRQF